MSLTRIQDAACVTAAAAAEFAVTIVPFSVAAARATPVSFAETVATLPASPALLGPKSAAATEEQPAMRMDCSQIVAEQFQNLSPPSC